LDIYYHSEKFKQLLRKYEELQENNISEIPCAEDLTDVAEYFHMLGEEEKALEVAEREHLAVFLIIKRGSSFETKMSSEFEKIINQK